MRDEGWGMRDLPRDEVGGMRDEEAYPGDD
jgi:hypothetical protein